MPPPRLWLTRGADTGQLSRTPWGLYTGKTCFAKGVQPVPTGLSAAYGLSKHYTDVPPTVPFLWTSTQIYFTLKTPKHEGHRFDQVRYEQSLTE